MKRRVNAVIHGWDNVVQDDSLRRQMECVATRLVREDPRHGLWYVRDDRAVVLTDVSSLAAGVAVETPQGDTIKDMCCLRRVGKKMNEEKNVCRVNGMVRQGKEGQRIKN